MRVELTDWNGYQRTITSNNPALIGDWFAEHAEHLVTGDSRLQVRIQFWPDSPEEMEVIGRNPVVLLTQEGLLHFAEKILETSKKIGELESAAAGG